MSALTGMLCPPRRACLRSCLPPCLPSGLGCCVRLLGSFPSPACLRSFVPSCFPAGLVCPCSGLVSKISCAICATVWGLRWCNSIWHLANTVRWHLLRQLGNGSPFAFSFAFLKRIPFGVQSGLRVIYFRSR